MVTESVKAHEISDVEVGSFLSGGIDSSVIAALSRPDKTYSVGFDREGFDETCEAKALCQELGLRNISETISAQEFFDILPTIQYYADEPNATCPPSPCTSCPGWRPGREGGPVRGGGRRAVRRLYHLPHHQGLPGLPEAPLPLRKGVAKAVSGLPYFHGQGFLTKAARAVEDTFVGQAFIFNDEEAQRVLQPAYRSGKTFRDITAPYYARVKNADDLTKMQYLDLHLWQPLDILRKADRMTMANSLELRVPYLDREVWKVARAIPSELKMSGQSTTKVPLRQAAIPLLPDDWIKRPKVGFPVPFIQWLREEKYYNWAKGLLSQDYVAEFFDRDCLLDLLERHYSGREKTHRKLYTVLSFLIWYQVYFPERCGAQPFVPAQ